RCRRLLVVPDIEELAPAMRPACDLGDARVRSRAIIECLEPGVGVSVQEAIEAGQMSRRMFAAAIGTVKVSCRRWLLAADWPIVAHINPKPAGLGATEARRQHRHRCVIAMDLLGREHVPP